MISRLPSASADNPYRDLDYSADIKKSDSNNCLIYYTLNEKENESYVFASPLTGSNKIRKE